MTKKNGYVNLDTDKAGIGTIEFYHPQSNSLPGELLNKLSTTITLASEKNEVRVIILKSAGERTFCAGASFQELIEIKNLKEGIDFFS